MAHSESWDATYEGKPAGGDSPATGDDEFRDLKRNVSERMKVEHDWGTGLVDAGKHSMGSGKVWVTNTEPTTAPSGEALDTTDTGQMWFNDSNGALTVYTGGNFVYPAYFDTDLNVTGDLTVGTNLDVGGTLTVTGNTTLSGDLEITGSLAVGTSFDLTLATNSAVMTLGNSTSTNTGITFVSTYGNAVVDVGTHGGVVVASGIDSGDNGSALKFDIVGTNSLPASSADAEFLTNIATTAQIVGICVTGEYSSFWWSSMGENEGSYKFYGRVKKTASGYEASLAFDGHFGNTQEGWITVFYTE